jgi:hypothetical protein
MSERLHASVKAKGMKPKASPARAMRMSTLPAQEAPDDRPIEQRAKAQIMARTAAREAAIAREAYYRAERRGFAPGYELDDWLAAEAEVDGNGPIEILASVEDPVDERHSAPDVTPVR